MSGTTVSPRPQTRVLRWSDAVARDPRHHRSDRDRRGPHPCDRGPSPWVEAPMMRVPDDELARRFDMPIARLSLPQRLQWVIESRGIETVRDLVQLSPDEVAEIRRC